MPQSKRRTKRKTSALPKSPKEDNVVKQPVNGILVRLLDQENGDRTITVEKLGDIKLTEAPTILRLAAKNAEGQLGVD